MKTTQFPSANETFLEQYKQHIRLNSRRFLTSISDYSHQTHSYVSCAMEQNCLDNSSFTVASPCAQNTLTYMVHLCALGIGWHICFIKAVVTFAFWLTS